LCHPPALHLREILYGTLSRESTYHTYCILNGPQALYQRNADADTVVVKKGKHLIKTVITMQLIRPTRTTISILIKVKGSSTIVGVMIAAALSSSSSTAVCLWLWLLMLPSSSLGTINETESNKDNKHLEEDERGAICEL